MTRPSALVLDGNQVKLRLQAERVATGSTVHVDWLRFTCLLRNAPTPSADDIFPRSSGPIVFSDDIFARERAEKMARILAELPDADFAASAQAKALAIKKPRLIRFIAICTGWPARLQIRAGCGAWPNWSMSLVPRLRAVI